MSDVKKLNDLKEMLRILKEYEKEFSDFSNDSEKIEYLRSEAPGLVGDEIRIKKMVSDDFPLRDITLTNIRIKRLEKNISIMRNEMYAENSGYIFRFNKGMLYKMEEFLILSIPIMPSQIARDDFKEIGFTWSGDLRSWTALDTDETRVHIEQVLKDL